MLVPIQMVSQTWDDHDRSGRYACRDFGQNYLNTLPDSCNPIIFTCGDNDTFPLWYNQEVEGERTDTRVCNLSYLQTDWYIDQMRRPAYDSPALPITWERINYAGNTNMYVYVYPMEKFIEQYRNAYPEKFHRAFGDNPYELNKITKHWILEADAEKKSEARLIVEEIISMYEKSINKDRRERFVVPRNVIPTKTLYIPIDSAAVKRSGMLIPEEYADNIPEYMTIDISDKNGLYRHELVLFDMLANANWERPLYMSMTVGDSNFPRVLKKNFVHEGLAYRITPFDWSKAGYDPMSGEHPVDIDRFGNVRRFSADNDIMKAFILQKFKVTHRRLDQKRRSAFTGGNFGCEIPLERSGIDADTNRYFLVFSCTGNRPDVFPRTDIPRIETECIGPRLYRRERAAVVKMNIGDHRNRRSLSYFAKNLRGIDIRNSETNDITTDRSACGDLLGKFSGIVRVDITHRLDTHRSAPADGDRSDLHRSRITSFEHHS